MIGSIQIAFSGLRGFEQGLQAISHNTANLNTPGFKGASSLFAELNSGQPFFTGNGGSLQIGGGLTALGTRLNFQAGQTQNTGNSLDLAMGGQGFFILQDQNGINHYTRDGQFRFNDDGALISVVTGEKVMGFDASGNLVPITLANLQTNPPKTTSTVIFGGNLSSTASSATIGNVTVIDANGTSHSLTATFAPVAGPPGNWTVTLKDGTATVGSGTLVFQNGVPTAASSNITLTYTPSAGSPIPLTLDFSSNVTSFDSGSSSTLAVTRQDGYGLGTLTQATFDATGTLVLSYSNGQTVKNKQLALAQFRSDEDVEDIGGNEFSAAPGSNWIMGTAGSGVFGKVQAGQIEGSNVDLSQEFTNLVIMQRGYQACSQVVSTATEMLAALYSIQSK